MMAYQVPMKQQNRGTQIQPKKHSYHKYTNKAKPTPKTFNIKAMPNIMKYNRNARAPSRDKSLTSADVNDIQKLNGLAQLEYNWKTRVPYEQNRKMRRLSKKLRKTEFTLLLNEQQMSECYEPVRLYEINKQLMTQNIGTCRVEGLKLILAVPNGRKDLTEGIQIIEKLIGPVQYLDDDNKKTAVRRAIAHDHFNTMHLNFKSNGLQRVRTKNDEQVQIYTSLPMSTRQRGTSLLSNTKNIGTPEKINSPKVTLAVQSEQRKRKPMRRYSEDYVDYLKKTQIKLLESQAMMAAVFDDDDEYDYHSDDEYDYKGAEHGDHRENTMTTVNIEQEWDDFDEIMTEDSIGIRVQAQVLMERKSNLRQQQAAIRERLKNQPDDDYRSIPDAANPTHPSHGTVIIHEPLSITSTFDADGIPCLDLPFEDTRSTIDDLYGTFDASKHVEKGRTESGGSEILESFQSLKRLSHDIDQELQSIDDTISAKNKQKGVSCTSSMSYNNRMLMMLRNEQTKRESSVLPFHRSQPQNEALLKIIHTIQNMPKPLPPEYNDYNDDEKCLIPLVIREYTSAFRELGLINTMDDDTYDGNQSRDRFDSGDTVPPAPSGIDTLPPFIVDNNNKAEHKDNSSNSSDGIVCIPKKKKNIKYILNHDNDNVIDAQYEYKYIEYMKSALFDDECNEESLSNTNTSTADNNVLHSLLAQSDLLSEIIFYNIPSIIKHFGFLLKIICSLSFGLQHQRERILATILKKVKRLSVTNTHYLLQKLLFLYWSFADKGNGNGNGNGNDNINYKDSDFYLYNDYGDLVLYGLSSVIYYGEMDAKFIVECAQCWRRILSHVMCTQEETEVVLDCVEHVSSFNIPSKILIASTNQHNIRYIKSLSQFIIHSFVYKTLYSYKNCNVYDVYGDGYHCNKGGNSGIKLKSPFLLRIGMDCKSSKMMQYIYDLINCMFSSYKYTIPNSNKIRINNKILFLQSQSIARNVGIWCLRTHLIHMYSVSTLNGLIQGVDNIVVFAHHFIVSSATIFISSYVMGLDWNEVLQTCFIAVEEYGDVYQLSPISVFCNLKNNDEESLNRVLDDDDNVFVKHIHTLLDSLQKAYNLYISNGNINDTLWSVWRRHVKRLFNIIVFNINEVRLNKDKKHYFDHSHLFQIIQLSKMLYSQQIQVHYIIKHFSNLLNVELNDKSN